MTGPWGAEQQVQPGGRSDSDVSIWFEAPAREQLALTADGEFEHVFPFVKGGCDAPSTWTAKVAEGVGNAPTSARPILFSGQAQPACICLPSVVKLAQILWSFYGDLVLQYRQTICSVTRQNLRSAMIAFLFTGWTSQFKAGRFGDSCVSSIIYGSSLEHARSCFEQWLLSANEAEDPTPTKIEKIVVAPILEHLFTEAGPVPMDWPQVSEEAARLSEANAAATFGQGYWVDCNELIRPGSLSTDLESLRAEVPDDVRSGLNWSEGKQFFYVVSALSPAATPPEETYDEDGNPVEAEPIHSGEDEPASFHLNDPRSTFPELADKEVAVVVRARNSIVAAWLCRRHAANTALAHNSIRVDPWLGAGTIAPES